jgi:SAM-dependent methyltransferase
METSPKRITEILRAIALQYPEGLVAAQLEDIERIAFHIELVVRRKGTDISICDIGGGIGLFSVGCAAVGMKATLVDDFRDSVNVAFGESILDLHKFYGVKVFSRDVLSGALPLAPLSLDAITSFDSMEHWHHSPKELFRESMIALKPNGLFLLACPNCVNLRKRLAVPLGHGKWSPMHEWYESHTFRGHTREPDIDDLRYIARDMGLERVTIFGRNWVGYVARRRTIRVATRLFDKLLRLRPSLCGDIYMLGYKP